MKKNSAFCTCLAILFLPLFGLSQVPQPTQDSLRKADSLNLRKADSLNLIVKDSTAMKADTMVKEVKTDTIVVKKDCYQEWYDTFRTRGGKTVPDGMQQVVIALKNEDVCHCFMGQIEVIGGKMKGPLFFQQENGEYRQVSTVGKKLEAAFAKSMTPEELYAVKDGMSIVFRTSEGEYGRLFFYKYVNKGAQSNKEAPSPTELIKE
jgi:hypothetical protein